MSPADTLVLPTRQLGLLEQAVASLEESSTFDRWTHLDDYLAAFQARFGPDILAGLDGRALLDRMHLRENQDCLMYWLEFKNDAEFPAIFGGIGGGSAKKFGIYQRHETGKWMGSTQSHIGNEISLEQAIDYARQQRDQLLRGCERVAQLPENASDDDYLALQKYFDENLPLVADWSWSHKYLHLIFPNKFDDFHNAEWQRFYLVKLLSLPPQHDGRFVCGGRYMHLAQLLQRPVSEVTWALQMAFGARHRYIRLDVRRLPGGDVLDTLRAEQCAGLGWGETGDLSDITLNRAGKAALQTRVAERVDLTTQGQNAAAITNDLFNLALHVDEGDLVVVADGALGKAIGRISGPYEYYTDSDLAHRRPVEWIDSSEWPCADEKHWARALSWFEQSANKLAVEQRLADPVVVPLPPLARLRGMEGRVQSILDRKGQVILYGPPGTGKTYWAFRAAVALIAQNLLHKSVEALTADERALVEGNISLCTFHPAYGYEDFLEGYRPEERDGQLFFKLRDGVFKRLCGQAASHPEQRFILVIDEINRGDIPRIFGELLTLLEKDKRGREVLLPLSGRAFSVPTNVFVIGTMNTADRSIALLDTALRRRFGFIELLPDSGVLGDAAVDGLPLGPWLDGLNARLVSAIGPDGRNLQIGHAYLLEGGHPVTTFAGFARIVRDDIVPLLQEYCYEDYRLLEQILGTSLVDASTQQVHSELFGEESREDLKLALVAIAPDITVSAQAVAAEVDAAVEASEEDAIDESQADVAADA